MVKTGHSGFCKEVLVNKLINAERGAHAVATLEADIDSFIVVSLSTSSFDYLTSSIEDMNKLVKIFVERFNPAA